MDNSSLTKPDPDARVMTILTLDLGIKTGWALHGSDQPITPAQVALCLIDVKPARLAHAPNHLDSMVDIAGYTAVLREVSR